MLVSSFSFKLLSCTHSLLPPLSSRAAFSPSSFARRSIHTRQPMNSSESSRKRPNPDSLNKPNKDQTMNNNNANKTNTTNMNQPKKQKREFDMSKYCKRHIALKVAYVGWDYHGFASQADKEDTIEGHVFAALHKTCLITSREESHYSRCGRTDKGVSAFGQVIGLHLRSNLTKGLGIIDPPEPNNNDQPEPSNETSQNTDSKNANNNKPAKEKTELDYAVILNRVLPPEIRVINWAPVPSHFNARFSALYRTYKYFFVPDGYDLEAMQQAAKHLVGDHDFRNFCKMDVENVKSFTRVILSVTVESGVVTISGFAFLWHQVRCMMAVLFMVGRHLEKPDIVATLLDITRVPAKPVYEMASEIPLVLFDCGYEDLQWTQSEGDSDGREDMTRKLVAHFESYFNDLYLKSKVVSLMLEATKATGVARIPPYPKI